MADNFKKITIPIELIEADDYFIKIEAAKQNLSKRKLAQKIVEEWIIDRKGGNRMKEKFTEIAHKSAQLPADESGKYEQAIDALIEDGTNIFTGMTDKKDLLLQRMAQNIEIIDNFCKKQGIEPLPTRNPEELAGMIVTSYFTSRSR